MQKNPNCWSLMALFFLMACLFAMGAERQLKITPEREVITAVHSPPMEMPAMMNTTTIEMPAVTWLSTSMPGVLNGTAEIRTVECDKVNNDVNYYLKEYTSDQSQPIATARNGGRQSPLQG